MTVWPRESMSGLLPQHMTECFLAVNIHFADFCSGFLQVPSFSCLIIFLLFSDELCLNKPNDNQLTTVLHPVGPRFLFVLFFTYSHISSIWATDNHHISYAYLSHVK